MTGAVVSIVGGAVGASALGSAHLRGGRPNQDAVGWDQRRLWTYLAVADGHGAAPHHRSDRGSRMAVEALLSVLRTETRDGHLRDAGTLAAAVPGLAAAIVARWRTAVSADLAADPLAEPSGDDDVLAYGTTCLGAAVGPGMTLWFQIGDGEVLAAASSGEVETIFEPDRYPGEETDSLCLPAVADRAKVALVTAPSPFAAPEIALVATDGVTKSFPDPAALHGVVRGFREGVRDRGLAALGAELGSWLGACARHGRGDDATLALFAADPEGTPSIAPVGGAP